VTGPSPGDRAFHRGLVDDVRRLGLDVAEEIAGRFARLVAPLDPARTSARGGPAGERGRGLFEPGGPILDRGRATDDVATATGLALRMLETVAAVAGEVAADDDRHDHVVVAVERPGASGGSILWIHNTTDHTAGEVTLVAGELVGSAGERLPGSVVSFDPSTIGELAAGSSRAVTVTVTPGPATPPAVYHGMVVAAGAGEAILRLRIEVGGEGTAG
jgi:hypothetical protein